MINNFLFYLIEATVCFAIFGLAYRVLFCQLTHFQWNRWYLLGSLALSILVPLLSDWSPFLLLTSPAGKSSNLSLALLTSPWWLSNQATFPHEPTNANLYPPVGLLVLSVYSIGVLYKSWYLLKSLRLIFKLIKQNQIVEKGPYYVVYRQEEIPTFSFLRYIFLQKSQASLTAEELQQVLQHEKVHVRQKHTLDLLFFELATIVFWFNPVLYYYRKSIRLVHEFIADSAITRPTGNSRNYGQLLLKLTSNKVASPLTHSFSDKQIYQRILMLTKTPSSPMHKFKFLFALPVFITSLALCSFLGSDSSSAFATPKQFTESQSNVPTSAPVPIRKITWKGNALYTAAELNKALGLSAGDNYTKEDLNKRLYYNPAGTDVAGLYMDKGYGFFIMEIKETPVNQSVDLEITITEGPKVAIGRIIIKGNKTVASEKVLQQIAIQPGELFNRSKIIKSQQAIAQMGLFNPEKISITPIPDQKASSGQKGGTVNLEYVLEEK